MVGGKNPRPPKLEILTRSPKLSFAPNTITGTGGVQALNSPSKVCSLVAIALSARSNKTASRANRRTAPRNDQHRREQSIL